VSRLIVYLRVLDSLASAGKSRTSSEYLGNEAQVSPFQVRKDLAYFGRFGTRGIGYDVAELGQRIRTILGLGRSWNTCIVGLGRLGQALVDYPGFGPQKEFHLVALFDTDSAKIGKCFGGLAVRHNWELPQAVAELNIQLGMIAVPASSAQEVATALVQAGIRGILNFAPAVIEVPLHVFVEKTDVSAALERLTFYLSAAQADRRPAP